MMKYPNFNEEKKLWKQGYTTVAGLDETGRGPLAGPVVAAAILFGKNYHIKYFNTSKYRSIEGIRDSKKLSSRKREELYGILTNHPEIRWGIGIVSEKIIDKINILEATKLAMQRAIKNLEKSIKTDPCQKIDDRRFFDMANAIDFLLIDGNFRINSEIAQKSIIKGDQKVFSISAASIIAKVTRDQIMQKMHKKYPQYGFNAHKGYGTSVHIENLKNFGPCTIHRKSFYPVSSFIGM